MTDDSDDDDNDSDRTKDVKGSLSGVDFFSYLKPRNAEMRCARLSKKHAKMVLKELEGYHLCYRLFYHFFLSNYRDHGGKIVNLFGQFKLKASHRKGRYQCFSVHIL